MFGDNTIARRNAMKLKSLFGLVASLALLTMFGCGGDGGGGGGTAAPTGSTVVASAGPGGDISPSGATRVLPTFTVLYTITPDPGFTVSDVKIDGFSFGAITSFEFATGGHTIRATFVRRPKTAVVSLVTVDPLGTGTPIGGIEATLLFAQNLGLTIDPADVVVAGNGVGATLTPTVDLVNFPGQVGLSLSSAAGIGAGQFATATFKLFSSVAGPVLNGNVPSPASFAIGAGATVTDTAAIPETIPGAFPFIGPVIIK